MGRRGRRADRGRVAGDVRRWWRVKGQEGRQEAGQEGRQEGGAEEGRQEGGEEGGAEEGGQDQRRRVRSELQLEDRLQGELARAGGGSPGQPGQVPEALRPVVESCRTRVE